MHIGPYELECNVMLAPMAGVTDRPFRRLCNRFGAGLVVSEMVSSNPLLRNHTKTRLRLVHAEQVSPRSVQIAGSDPRMMADAARFNVDRGAQIIDVNFGCPAKKVCNAMAGSALLKDEALIGRILEQVVNAVEVPVTVKMRTGWDATHRNGVRVARIAESVGVQMLAIHGRTRACGYRGQAEYETVAAIKRAVSIPVVVNGDIGTPVQARAVLARTGADGVMIGRAAQGAPWLFREIREYLAKGVQVAPPTGGEVTTTVLEHLRELYELYGENRGVRVARKHLAWYSSRWSGGKMFWDQVKRVEQSSQQYKMTSTFLIKSALGAEAA